MAACRVIAQFQSHESPCSVWFSVPLSPLCEPTCRMHTWAMHSCDDSARCHTLRMSVTWGLFNYHFVTLTWLAGWLQSLASGWRDDAKTNSRSTATQDTRGLRAGLPTFRMLVTLRTPWDQNHLSAERKFWPERPPTVVCITDRDHKLIQSCYAASMLVTPGSDTIPLGRSDAHWA